MESSWIRVILNRSVGVVTIPFGHVYRSHLVRATPVAIETKVINGAVQSSQRNAAKHKSADALKSLGARSRRLCWVLVLVGPSGSGKSTFLRCINHLEEINAGRLYVDGELVGYRERGDKLHEMRAARGCRKQRRDIGMVFQHFNLFPHMTALENIIEAPIQVKRRDEGGCGGNAASELLDQVGLAKGGRLSRAAVRRAAAARRDRPGAGDGPQADAVRRAHLGARPGAGRRGARRDEAARPRTA